MSICKCSTVCKRYNMGINVKCEDDGPHTVKTFSKSEEQQHILMNIDICKNKMINCVFSTDKVSDEGIRHVAKSMWSPLSTLILFYRK